MFSFLYNTTWKKFIPKFYPIILRAKTIHNKNQIKMLSCGHFECANCLICQNLFQNRKFIRKMGKIWTRGTIANKVGKCIYRTVNPMSLLPPSVPLVYYIYLCKIIIPVGFKLGVSIFCSTCWWQLWLMATYAVWLFGTFLVGRGDIMYWLEMTCFWFVMILCITIYIGGWWGLLVSAKRLTHMRMESMQWMQ